MPPDGVRTVPAGTPVFDGPGHADDDGGDAAGGGGAGAGGGGAVVVVVARGAVVDVVVEGGAVVDVVGAVVAGAGLVVDVGPEADACW
jgi:hypothetical protein